MLEHSHLRIIQALHNKGTLTEASTSLNLSQSALSHQIRHLEKKLGINIWERGGRKLRLTQAGEVLLNAALQVLPVLDQAQDTLRAYAEGKQGTLRIGVECYPCFEWLTGVIGGFMRAQPEIEIDIINRFRFSGLEGLIHHHIDLLVTPDEERHPGIQYQPMAAYTLMLFVASSHRLAAARHIKAEDLAPETLLSFPVPTERLDVFTRLLTPAGVQPHRHKQLESIELMLELIAQGRGVSLLPGWLPLPQALQQDITKRPIGTKGMPKQLFVALREGDRDIGFIDQFIAIGRHQAQSRFAVEQGQ